MEMIWFNRNHRKYSYIRNLNIKLICYVFWTKICCSSAVFIAILLFDILNPCSFQIMAVHVLSCWILSSIHERVENIEVKGCILFLCWGILLNIKLRFCFGLILILNHLLFICMYLYPICMIETKWKEKWCYLTSSCFTYIRLNLQINLQ